MRNAHLSPAIILSISLLALLPSCSSGGDQEGLEGQIKLAANHYLFGFIGRPSFAAFPTSTTDLETVDGRFFLKDTGRYEMRRSTGVLLSEDEYALYEEGVLSIAVPTSTSTIVYGGGYGREGGTGDVFLTDRIGAGVGLYVGAPLVQGPANLPASVGEWHVFTLHALLAPAGSVPDEDLVGIGFGGRLTLAADGSFAGTGTESESGNVSIHGAAGDFQAFVDGQFAFEIEFDPLTRPDYQRGFVAGGSARFIAGVDEDTGGTDAAAGLVLLMKRRSAAFAAADVVGKYRLGMQTIFLRPDASGSDASLGQLELKADLSFRIDATNNLGQAFSYAGNYTAAEDGALVFTVTGTNETWYGAFDDNYDTVVFVDPFKEIRSSLQKELNLGMALRVKIVP